MTGLGSDEALWREAIAANPWVARVRTAFLVGAVGQYLVGLLLGAAGMLGWQEYFTSEHAMPVWFYVLWPVALCSAGFVPGTLWLIAARGLRRGSRLAWIYAVVVGVLQLLSCCFPFGAFVLYGLLREDVRSLFVRR